MSIQRSIIQKLYESKGLYEAEFTAGGSVYKCVFGKYYKDNEQITRDDYFKAKEEGGISGSAPMSNNQTPQNQVAPKKKSPKPSDGKKVRHFQDEYGNDVFFIGDPRTGDITITDKDGNPLEDKSSAPSSRKFPSSEVQRSTGGPGASFNYVKDSNGDIVLTDEEGNTIESSDPRRDAEAQVESIEDRISQVSPKEFRKLAKNIAQAIYDKDDPFMRRKNMQTWDTRRDLIDILQYGTSEMIEDMNNGRITHENIGEYVKKCKSSGGRYAIQKKFADKEIPVDDLLQKLKKKGDRSYFGNKLNIGDGGFAEWDQINDIKRTESGNLLVSYRRWGHGDQQKEVPVKDGKVSVTDFSDTSYRIAMARDKENREELCKRLGYKDTY